MLGHLGSKINNRLMKPVVLDIGNSAVSSASGGQLRLWFLLSRRCYGADASRPSFNGTIGCGGQGGCFNQEWPGKHEHLHHYILDVVMQSLKSYPGQ